MKYILKYFVTNDIFGESFEIVKKHININLGVVMLGVSYLSTRRRTCIIIFFINTLIRYDGAKVFQYLFHHRT